jgi:basic membrane protein A
MKKWYGCFALVLIMAMLMTGCGAKPTGEAPAAADAKLRAALLTSGPVNDGGFNMLAYNGLLELEKMGFEVANTENVTQDSQKAAIEAYTAQGYNLIIGNGYEFGEALAEAAVDNPDIYFFQVSGSMGGQTNNMSSAEYRATENGYYAGYIAANLTETNKVGFVGAQEIPTVAEEARSYESTVQKLNPDITFQSLYTGSWTDIVAGKNAAKQLIDAGCDVIGGLGDACDAGVMQAIEEAQAQGKKVWMIGWSADFNISNPGKDYIATSLMQDTGKLIASYGQQILDGTWQGKAAVVGTTEDVQYIGTWDETVPQDVKDICEAEVQKIKDGTLNKKAIFEWQGRPESEYYKQVDED